MSGVASFTVGIKNEQGKLVGTGFVIADGVIVTCAHVLYYDVFGKRKPAMGDPVTVRFSHLGVDGVTKVQKYDNRNDVAILHSDQPFPAGGEVAPLCSPTEIQTPVMFLTAGYRDLGSKREGNPAHGKLVGPVLRQLGRSTHAQLVLDSKQIGPGMSGAPLYIPSMERVVGMITSYWDAEKKQTGRKDIDTAFAVPIEGIQEVWPTLQFQAPLRIPDGELKSSLAILFGFVREYISFILKTKGEKSEAWQQVAWEEAASRYAEKMGRLYGTMRVLGKPEPVSLEGIYTDVHLLDRLTARRRYSREQLEKEFADATQRHGEGHRQDGFEVVRRKDKLFVLGQPGAGKTTFLKYMTLQAVTGRIKKVPIFVSLKALADSGQKVLPFIIQHFEICDFPDAGAFVEQLLKRGEALVLFDGLDEVPQEGRQRARLIDELDNFTRQYDASHYIITCRIAATEYRFDLFTYVEMADFTPAQVKVFVGQWFEQDEPKRKGFLQQLEKKAHRGLREMTRQPLLLTMLCLTYEETLTFPARRVEIYEEALDALLKKWDASRNIQRDDIYRKLSLGRKRHLFARVAAETFEKGAYFIPQSELAKKIEAYLPHVPPHNPAEEIDGVAILKAIEAQHGIFSERARGIYSFAHLTFQEYFTAKYIVDNEARGTVEGLIAHHLSDNRWREVFLLTASLLDDADHFFERFLKQLNQPIGSDKHLLTLLIWADKKAADASYIQKISALRSAYIYVMFFFYIGLDRNLAQALARSPSLARSRSLALTEALDRTLDLTQGINRELAQDRALDQALDQALDRALGLARALGRNRALARDRALALVLARDRDLARDLARDLEPSSKELLNFNLDFLLVHSWLVAAILSKTGLAIEADVRVRLLSKLAKVIEKARQISQNLDDRELHQALQQIALPEANASQAAWQTFYHALERIMRTYRQFEPDRQLTTEQYQRLATYLGGTQFLLECLELAYVSNREAIEAQLLLPLAPVEVKPPVEEQLPPDIHVEVEQSVKEVLPLPAPTRIEVEQPVEESLPPVKDAWYGKWWAGLLLALLVQLLVSGLLIWLLTLQ
ncbi:MAG: NACHT domain-containing protein [Ardenticatenaceae bacterium]